MTQPKHDVAISFLSADAPIAAALYSKLSEGLDVFFYPRSQEELAGTNGLETMRTPFLEESRVVVVLYREPWGQTPWTRVEETAISEGCLKNGWQRLFFMMLDKANVVPKWVPTTHVRYYSDFGLEQAIGAIKARVQEAGGVIAPLTALKRSELAAQETQYLKEKAQLRSPLGHSIMAQATLDLFMKLREVSAEVHAGGHTSIEFESDTRQCHLRNRVSLILTLNLYSQPKLEVCEFDNRLRMGRENMLFYPNGEPRRLSKTTYLPDMNRAREYGWSKEGQPASFLSPAALADNIVSQFIKLAARVERGKFAP